MLFSTAWVWSMFCTFGIYLNPTNSDILYCPQQVSLISGLVHHGLSCPYFSVTCCSISILGGQFSPFILCSGYHCQETKPIVRPCGETRWPHASQPRIITGRSSKNWLLLWSWLTATARTPAPFMDPANRRWYTLQHSCLMVQGSSSWPLWVDTKDLCCLRDLMMMMMRLDFDLPFSGSQWLSFSDVYLQTCRLSDIVSSR